MAAEDWAPAPVVSTADAPARPIVDWKRDGASYGFFQALRLMRLGFASDAEFRGHVRVQPNLSLAFPEGDIQAIDQDADGNWRVVANFFGLYGVSSPLPTYYTEDLIEEVRNGRSAMRDFLDIIHARLYPMLFSAWEKYRLWIAVSERADVRRLEQLLALIGRAGISPGFNRDGHLLRFAGLFSQFPRSALGLETLVRGLLRGAPVVAEPCVSRIVPIPRETQFVLGEPSGQLGNALIGSEVEQRSSAVVLHVGPIDAQHFDSLLPGGPAHALLSRDLALYLNEPVQCELCLLLDSAECRPALLGVAQWSRLGLDMWLGTGDEAEDADDATRWTAPRRVSFELPLCPDASLRQQVGYS
jgi:type VI secretion system protein ImpH